VVLAILATTLLVIFGGITDRLIPLFAVGAFLAFTMSQAGMVAHWRRVGGKGAMGSMIVNGFGALATGATLIVVLVAKFTEGAWVVAFLILGLIALMTAVHRHYQRVARETAPIRDFLSGQLKPPLIVVPIEAWNSVAQKALRFALSVSDEVKVVHVESDGSDSLANDWERDVKYRFRTTGRPPPELVVLRSPYRLVIQPILDFVLELEDEHKGRMIGVVIPALVEYHWYHYFLHNQRGELLTAMLLVKGDRRIVIIDVPWYLRA
jgi:MFS family permease